MKYLPSRGSRRVEVVTWAAYIQGRLCIRLESKRREGFCLAAAVSLSLQTSADYSRFIGAPKQPSILAINFPERKLIEVPLRGDEK